MATATLEGCPTPLAWQQVVEEIRQQGVRHRVEVDGVTVTALSLGEGPPLYLLPGFLGDHELFALTAWLLREECRCVLLDPPVGPPDEVRAEHLLQRWADGVLHLAQRLEHDRLRLFGSSFGGMLALQMMAAHPDRLDTVALHCGFARMRLRLIERCLIAVGRRSSRRFGQLPSALRIQEQNHRAWFPPFDAGRWEFFAENIAATPAADAALRTRVAGRVDLRDQLHLMSTPTLLVQSEGDGRVAWSAQAELMQRLPDVRVEGLDNSGRLPYITHPHRLVRLLRDFWDQTS